MITRRLSFIVVAKQSGICSLFVIGRCFWWPSKIHFGRTILLLLWSILWRCSAFWAHSTHCFLWSPTEPKPARFLLECSKAFIELHTGISTFPPLVSCTHPSACSGQFNKQHECSTSNYSNKGRAPNRLGTQSAQPIRAHSCSFAVPAAIRRTTSCARMIRRIRVRISIIISRAAYQQSPDT